MEELSNGRSPDWKSGVPEKGLPVRLLFPPPVLYQVSLLAEWINADDDIDSSGAVIAP